MREKQLAVVESNKSPFLHQCNSLNFEFNTVHMGKASKIQQLTFFDLTPDEINAKNIEEVKQSLHKVRKGVYANIGELKRDVSEMKVMFEHMIHVVCKGVSPDDLK